MRCALVMLLLSAAVASAATVDLKIAKDNTLYFDEAGSLSNGRGDYFFVGRTSDGNLRRTVLQFDATSIPSFATVTSATLTLHVSRSAGGSTNVTLQRLTSSFGEGPSNAEGQEGGGTSALEGDATWLHRAWPNVYWNTPGGDFAPLISAARSVSGFGNYTWSSAQLTADVQAWVQNSSGNLGWILRGNETTNRTAKRFDSQHSPDLTVRPRLTVTYTIPEPGAGALLAGVALLARRR